MGTKKPRQSVIYALGGVYFFAVGVVALATWLKYLAQPDIIPANVPILYVLARCYILPFYSDLARRSYCSVISVIAYDYYFLHSGP